MRTLLPNTIAALDTWARDNAALFKKDPVGQVARSAVTGKRIILDREWIVQQMYNMTFKDEHDHVVTRFREELADDPASLAAFEALAAVTFTPRDDAVFAQKLEEMQPPGYCGRPDVNAPAKEA